MSQAVFGLLGVAVGAVVTGGIELYRQRRGERRAFQTARRLVSNELHTIWVQCEIIARKGQRPVRIELDRFLPSDLWRSHREVLADGPEDLWRELARVYDSVESMRWVVLQQDAGAELPEAQRKRIGETAALIGELYNKITGEPPN